MRVPSDSGMQTAGNGTEGTTGRVVRNYSPVKATRSSEIREALTKAEGSRRSAAKILGLARNTLANRLAEIGQRYLMKLPIDVGDQVMDTVLAHYSYEYDLSTLTPETWNQGRGCFYCGVKFIPKRPHDWIQHFCCTEHRKLYNFTPMGRRLALPLNGHATAGKPAK
jgi:hypothetical protein